VLPVPTARQLAWDAEELSLFFHFGVNTFTDREWGTGAEDPGIFSPDSMDADQWLRTARAAGFGRAVLTAKHHDGFCLWPSRTTAHSVAASPWKGGRGDVVAEFAAACRRHGVAAGLYLSPWDRHEPRYGAGPAYNVLYAAQLRELLEGYGALSEVWFDGACGEGPGGRTQEYEFPLFWALGRQIQPGAVLFSDAGPDVRWIGNEKGFAGDTCWSMMDKSGVRIGAADTRLLNRGDASGPDWVPGECDVSIRPGWFWHPGENPKTPAELMDIYFGSVGRNGVLLLNVPPDRRGRLDDRDVRSLAGFHAAIEAVFSRNLAAGARASASAVRGGDDAYGPGRVLDGDARTYWAPDDSAAAGTLTFAFAEPVRFNVLRVSEPVALGQRIASYRVEAEAGGGWKTVARGATAGRKRLDRFEAVTARRVRLSVASRRGCPLVSEFGLHWNPAGPAPAGPGR
jgi:alpha-L-fucosidase